MKSPKLRTAEKVAAPYPRNSFPKGFGVSVGRLVIYLLATKKTPSLVGEEWEQIFAEAIGADWKPSNVGLDDVVLGNCAWGAKTVKARSPWKQKSVRLISGRNSPAYSYGSDISLEADPRVVGEEVVEIWNARVDAIRSKYKHARTVVLIKSDDLLKLTVFELELLRFDSDKYLWEWNKNSNLVGSFDGEKIFTWQPHGSQFTIIEEVPETKLCLKLKKPMGLDVDKILDSVGFDEGWIVEVDGEFWK